MSIAQWTPTAEIDMEDIYGWIAHHDGRRSIAKSVLRELRRECDVYANAFANGSTIGTPQPDLGDDLRTFHHKRWVVVFRPLVDGIEVFRVLDGSRDFPRIFGG